MEFRSTQSRFVHFQGDVVSNVSSGGVENSSHGVQLTGGSTGGIVTAAGDETNIALNVIPKGSGPLVLGAAGNITIGSGAANVTFGSSGTILIGSSGASLQLGGSTTPFSGMIRFTDTAVATPNFATTNAMVMETTHTITGVSSQTLGAEARFYIIAQPHNLSTDCALVNCFVGSTGAEVHCRFAKVSTLSVAASTATISFLVFRV